MLYQRYRILKEAQRREMSTIINLVEKNMNQALKYSYSAALSLGMQVNNEGEVKNFEEVASRLVDNNPNINAVEIVEGGVITHVYPFEENKAALGLQIFEKKIHRIEALRAVEDKQMFFAGPLELKQGGLAVIGRLPILKNNELWGFSAVIIRLDNLLAQSGIDQFSNEEYNFQFSKIENSTRKETFFLPAFENFDKSYSEEITLPDGDWKFYIFPKNPNEIVYILLPGMLLIIFLSGLFGFILYKYSREPEILKAIVDKKSRQLFKSENKFLTVFNQAAIGMAVIDSNTGILLQSNSKLQQQLGYTNEELLELDFKTITPQVDFDENQRLMRELCNNKRKEYSHKIKLLKKNGEYIWVRLTVSALWQLGEKPSTHIALIEDISESERVKKELRRSELKFRTIFNQAAVGMSRTDSVTGNILESNKAFQNLIGYTEEELTNKPFKEISHPDEIQENLNLLKKLQRNEIKNYQIAKRFIRKDGKIRWVHLSVTPLWNEKQKFNSHIAIIEDITERVEAQRKLEKSEDRFRALVEYSNEMILILDKNKKTIYSSPAFKKLMYQKEVKTNSLLSLVHSDDQAYVKKKLEESKKLPGTPLTDIIFRSVIHEDQVIWNDMTINNLLEQESIQGFVLNIRNITESKESELRLKDSYKLVKEQNKRLVNFSYIVSHNLRSHSSNLESLLGLYQSSDSEEEKEEYLNLLPAVSNNLSQTLYDLNEVISIHNNHSLKMEYLNIKSCISHTLESFALSIKEKNAEIDIEVPEDMELYLNPAYLESIMHNLISNALRYCHAERNPRISIKGFQENNTYILEVSDNGIGIDLDKNRDKIFGLYNTFSNSTNSRGIGLFITKNQVEAMGGRIKVKSEIGKGSSFKIYIN